MPWFFWLMMHRHYCCNARRRSTINSPSALFACWRWCFCSRYAHASRCPSSTAAPVTVFGPARRRRGLGYLLGTWKCPNDNDPTTCNPCGKHSGADDSWGYLNGGGAWEHIACRTYDISPAEFPDKDPKTFNVSRSGFITTIHLTDLGIEGAPRRPAAPRLLLLLLMKMRRCSQFCVFEHLHVLLRASLFSLRLLLSSSRPDGMCVSFAGAASSTGTLESLKSVFCPFVHLRELDLDGSHLTGPLPEWLSTCFRARIYRAPG